MLPMGGKTVSDAYSKAPTFGGVPVWTPELGWTDAVQFFYEHAGYSWVRERETEVEGRRRGAVALAEAEARALAGPFFFDAVPDDQPWDGDAPYDGPLWVVTLYSVEGSAGGNVLGSLGSVACEADDDYMRVVRAELALEYLPRA